MTQVIFEERRDQIFEKSSDKPFRITCDKQSLAGAVSQRACVFCGSRVVLYPIADALHLVHGPIGCASYSWDIRGSLSSGRELHRYSFSTDLGETDVIFGGESKLTRALDELIPRHRPKAAFVYSTCMVGLIGDDIQAVCKKAQAKHGIPVISVMSEGFKGNKRAGYYAACHALFKLVGTAGIEDVPPMSVNLLGDFNLAGEIWIIRRYLEQMGINVVANVTGDGRVDDLRRAHGASLNLVQCSGSTLELARMMEEAYGIPFLRVSYLGADDMAQALYDVADFFKSQDAMQRAKELVSRELSHIYPRLKELRKDLEGKRAALYVGGAFKAFSLIRSFRLLGMRVMLAGSQTGTQEDYEELAAICEPGTVIVDDANPLELMTYLVEKDVDVFVGGVKERPIAHKLGIGFCDHNHERKLALEGFVGMLNFAEEIHATAMSPVWRFMPRRSHPALVEAAA